MENPASKKCSFNLFSVSFLSKILKTVFKQGLILLEKEDMLALPGLRASSKQNNYFRRQYFAKYISNLIGFNENLDFK